MQNPNACERWNARGSGAANFSHPDQRNIMKKTVLVVLWVMAVSWLGLSCANAQVKWEQDSGSPWSWFQSQTLWNELTQSVHEFFGTAVGAFLTQSLNTPHTIPPREWALISTQFLRGAGESGTWNRGTVLNGQWQLYAFSTGSGITTAFVTRIHDTRVVAAAMAASEYRRLPLADLNNTSAFRARVLNGLCEPFDAKCQRAGVTIFFKDKFDFNPEISNLLKKIMSQALLSECEQLRTDVNSAYSAKYGTPPPQCHVRADITFVNQLPHE